MKNNAMFEKAISVLLEQEAEKRINERVTKYIDYISKSYDISMKLLLLDWKNVDGLEVKVQTDEKVKAGQCVGINSINQKRCAFKGKFGGYCSKHRDQRPVTQVIKTSNSSGNLQHNHTIPPMFSKDCPACQKKNGSKQNLLIEI